MDRDTAYDAPTGCRLAELAPGAGWAAVASDRERAEGLAQRAALAPGAAIAVDDPAWRARLRARPIEDATLVALPAEDAPPPALLDALRLLLARAGVVAILSPDAPQQGRQALAGQITHGRVVRVWLADGVVPALVRARQRVVAGWPAATAARRARLADGLPRLAADGPTARALVAGSARADGRAASPATSAHDADAAAADVVLQDATAPARDGQEDASVPAPRGQAALVTVEERWLRATLDPRRDRPWSFRFAPTQGRRSLMATEPLPAGLEHHTSVALDAADATPWQVAAQVVRCSLRGLAATVHGTTEPWRHWIGDELAGLLDDAAHLDLDADLGARERLAVRLWRAALRGHRPEPRLRALLAEAGAPLGPPPSVSVLLSTARPELLDHALAQVRRQRHRPLQVVLIAHGAAAVAAARDLPASAHGDLDLVVRAVEGDRPFGEALQAGAAIADGAVLTKMDDDDWYGPDHVGDLVEALSWTGAPLVGKPFDFLYLARHDVTVRRRPPRNHVYAPRVNGASLTVHRADLQALGGWAPVHRAVDRRLIEAAQRDGERCFRIHGLGMLINRHGQGHTWPVGTDYELARARWQRPGFAGEEACLDG